MHPTAGKCALVNYSEDVYRQRFSAAHEMAHAIFDSGSGPTVSFKGQRDNLEYRANRFASCYLMPPEFLRRLSSPSQSAWTEADAQHWANELRVSCDALGIALKEAQLVDQAASTRIRSFRVPREAKIDPELPQTLNEIQRGRKEALLERGLSNHYVELCFEAYGQGAISLGLVALPRNPNSQDWWMAVHSPETDETGATPALEQILEVADRASTQDALARQTVDAREADAAEHRRLNDARVWIAEHRTRRDGTVQAAAQARARIEQWETANANLIQRAEQEGQANVRDRPIKTAYDSFLRHLESFRERLPGMLMADLNVTAMELYNEFNYIDRDEDKLAELRLPLRAEGVIEIAFRGNPRRLVNALTALSEGYIRCLGLAILLAKAQSVRAPLIIFDDAVNAIDHDHRGGIRAAIFESDRFRETQIIVTCHSQEFVKDVENSLPRELRADCQQYALRHHDGNHQPRVNPDVGSANYLARARQAMGRHDSRDALSYARKALEMFMYKAWKWLESHRVGNISVQIDGPAKELNFARSARR